MSIRAILLEVGVWDENLSPTFDQAEQELKDLFLSWVGEDETENTHIKDDCPDCGQYMDTVTRNSLRAEIRERLNNG